jgi:hypothetical protein
MTNYKLKIEEDVIKDKKYWNFIWDYIMIKKLLAI